MGLSQLGVARGERYRVGIAAAAAVVVVAVTSLPLAGAGATDVATASRGTVISGRVERVFLDNFAANAPRPGGDVLTFVRTLRGTVKVPSAALADVPNSALVTVGIGDTSTIKLANGVGHPATSVAASTDPETGADVTGVQVDATVSSTQVDTGLDVATTDPAIAAGAASHSVLVVVADLPGEPVSTLTAAQVANTINGSVNSYWSNVSHGAVRFSATAYAGSLDGHIATSSKPCDNGSVAGSFSFWNEIVSKSGFKSGSGMHLVVYFHSSASCAGLAGLGTVGGTTDSGDIASGGMVWSNGYNTLGVLGHELGHNLGLGHSQELKCGTAVESALSHCTKIGYNDLADVMGRSWSNGGYLNATHLERLGLLPTGDLVTVAGSQSVTLAPLASGSGTRVASVHVGSATYLFEYRVAVGLDSFIGTTPFASPGVTVRKVLDRDALTSTESAQYLTRESLLLDGSPATVDDLTAPSTYRVVLPVGAVVSLAQGALQVRIDTQSSTGATLELALGSALAPDPVTVVQPRAAFRAGHVVRSVGHVRVPMRWAWTVRSADGTITHRTGNFLATLSAAWQSSSYQGGATLADATVVDADGHVDIRLAPARSIRYSASWRAQRSSLAIGGTERVSRHRGGTVRVRVSGSGIALIARRSTHRGSVAIYVDGKYVARVSERGSRTGPLVLWHYTFAAPGVHVIKIVNTGRTGRAVSVDGLVLSR